MLIYRWLLLIIALILFTSCQSETSPEAIARADQMRAVTEATTTAAAIQAKAAETSVAGQAQATATLAAVSAQGTRDANSHQATATAAAWLQQSQATETAVPNQAWNNDVANSNNALRQLSLSLGLLLGILACFGLLLATGALVRKHSHQVNRDANGNLPGWNIDGMITDPQRSLGPQRLAKPNLIDYAFWLYAMRITQELLPPPQSHWQVHDGNATAQQLLQAAQSANQPATMRSIFGGADSPKQLAQRVEVLKQTQAGNLLKPASSDIKLTIYRPGDPGQLAELVGNAFGVPPQRLLSEPTPIEGEYTQENSSAEL